jgi:hypothetical protein
MMVKTISSDIVTVERLERALVLLAYAMECDGPVYAPLFDKLEDELKTLRRQQDTVSRAKRLLASYSVAGGVKAIR